jgi:hypothetical protein
MSRCLDAGLNEITFSLHGPNAKVHDALVGTRGAFDEETRALRSALADGRPIVNIDVVINRGNVKYLPDMLEKFYGWGVKEFDLLQVVPFGRAYTDGRETLFYDLRDARPYIEAALEFSRKPDVHIWFNRFPPEHLEGYEHLIQDPYKLNDEVRGRKEEFARLLDNDIDLDCREAQRCRYCYVERLCDQLYAERERIASEHFDVVRVDTGWEAVQEPVFGGDPASARKSKADGKVRLPMVDASPTVRARTSENLLVSSSAPGLRIVAADLAAALDVVRGHAAARRIELELGEYKGLDAALGAELSSVELVRVVASSVHQAERLLEIPGEFEVLVLLDRETAPWLAQHAPGSTRLAVRQPTYERLTEAVERDVEVRAFFASLPPHVPVEGVPSCIAPNARPEQSIADTAMMSTEGRLEIFRFTKRFILEHYRIKSLRCATCVHEASCRGLHVNYVRAHGFDAMQPVELTPA